VAKTWREWEQPLIELEENIAKLRELSRREPDGLKRASLEKNAI
jgi:hypothetical protein